MLVVLKRNFVFANYEFIYNGRCLSWLQIFLYNPLFMKKAIIVVILFFPIFCIAQTGRQKLSKDSIQYYQRQLKNLWKSSYDSLVNSEKYKEINQKLNPNGKTNSDNFGVELTFFTGLQINNYDNLNIRLKSLGIKEVKKTVFPVGIGLSFRFNNIIVGYDLSIISGDNSNGAYGNGYISTNILKTKKWIFSPQIGIGGQNVIVRIPTLSSSNNFNSYFTTSANQVEITNKNTVLDFAMAFKIQIKDRNTYAPLFRLGYRYGLNESNWEIKNGTSTNPPKDRNNNFYIQLRVGFGD